MNAAANTVISPVYPDRCRVGDKEVVVGPKGYSLLVHVISRGGMADLATLARAVYGVSEVDRNRVDQQVHRLNARLAEAGCESRLTVDGDRVALLT